ncbi:unnamed protein product [Durusdinium trenchii]|uniref:Uncharacterized protein n=1 Tax=Durusdinium trenchii TaxID=1381693 RepID=A0ABP0QKN6_9DINO
MWCHVRPTPLEEYSKSLHNSAGHTEPMLFPMYTVPAKAILSMTTLEPHEALKLQGLLVEFDKTMGKALFVSHQWVGRRHPDPDFIQFSVLQEALRHLMSEVQYIVALPSVKPFATAELKSAPLFVWYDYFSCPQLEHLVSHVESGLMSDLAKAVSSIPLYVAECSFFFALCPVIESKDHSKLLGPQSWASRGWCRIERCCRELSPQGSWVMIRSAKQMELISSPVATLGFGSPGEGLFTVEEDRQRLGPVVLTTLQRKLRFLLQSGDLVGYRVLLNHQPLFLRGFHVPAMYDFVPGFEADPFKDGALTVSKFLYNNGFSKVTEVDKVGWTPLHYAGCRGDPDLVRALLAQRANPNVKAAKDNVMAGARSKWRVMTSVAACRHHEVARILIEAKAELSGTQLVGACIGNDPEGVRLLCEVGGVSPHAADYEGGYGVPAIHLACMYGATAALEELVAQAATHSSGSGMRQGSIDVSHALWLAPCFGNCSAELVNTLLDLRADVNEQFHLSVRNPVGLLVKVMALKHRFGKQTHFSRISFHANGATPLMQAVMGGQYEAAAALIARGARLDLRNSHGYTVADLAMGRSPPAFLVQAFEGQLAGCLRVASLAVGSTNGENGETEENENAMIEVHF